MPLHSPLARRRRSLFSRRRFPRRRFPRRFVVADRSMEPTLVEGQGLIGVPVERVRVGQLRTFEHPDRPGFWLVKRVAAIDSGLMTVTSDNSTVATIDSRIFGPVTVAGSYLVVARVPLRWM